MPIRRLLVDELDELLVLYAHLHASDEPVPHAAVLAAWAQVHASAHAYRYFGAFDENRLVASCNLSVVPNLTRGARPYGVVENVVTHADFRRRGHGTALLRHALADAWNTGCYKVMLMTGRKDEATLRFYEAAGFDRHGKQAFMDKVPGSLA